MNKKTRVNYDENHPCTQLDSMNSFKLLFGNWDDMHKMGPHNLINNSF